MSRFTKAEAAAAARVIEAALAGSIEDADFRNQDEDPDRLRELLESATTKLWERA